MVATPGERSVLEQSAYLLMPAMAMAIVYFGYIARITRAGVIGVLDADYTRTAAMKGLTKATCGATCSAMRSGRRSPSSACRSATCSAA